MQRTFIMTSSTGNVINCQSTGKRRCAKDIKKSLSKNMTARCPGLPWVSLVDNWKTKPLMKWESILGVFLETNKCYTNAGVRITHVISVWVRLVFVGAELFYFIFCTVHPTYHCSSVFKYHELGKMDCFFTWIGKLQVYRRSAANWRINAIGGCSRSMPA